MNDFVIDPPARAALPVEGGGRFPVRRVYCIGRNYAAHAVEMGHDPDREPPFFFAEERRQPRPIGRVPLSAAQPGRPPRGRAGGGARRAAAATSRSQRRSPASGATRSPRHDPARPAGRRQAAGRPWEIAKAFERSAPIGPLVPAARSATPTAVRSGSTVNGALRQQGDIAQMIWKVPEMIAYLSELLRARAGRHHPVRHPGRRRRRRPRRRDAGADRRPAGPRGARRLRTARRPRLPLAPSRGVPYTPPRTRV